MSTATHPLFDQRSVLAQDLLAYYDGVIKGLDSTGWWREKKQAYVSVTGVGVPARVLEEDTSPPIKDDEQSGRRLARPKEPEVDLVRAKLTEQRSDDKRRKEVLWSSELRSVKRGIILGAPGGGKTFLTKTTVIKAATEAHRLLAERAARIDSLTLPIRLSLPALSAEGVPDDFTAAAIHLLKGGKETQSALASAPLESWIRRKILTDSCLLVLDALDEVVDDQAARRLWNLLRFLEGTGARVVLTCRTLNFNRNAIPWGSLKEYDLAPFTSAELLGFVRKWFEGDAARLSELEQVFEGSPSLEEACHTPLIATLACLEHEYSPLGENTRRVDLYARVLRSLQRKRWRPLVKAPPMSAPPQDPELDFRRLRGVAFELFASAPQSNLFTWGEMAQAHSRAVPDANDMDASRFIFHVQECAVLVSCGKAKDGEPQYSFHHRTFLEFLAADYLGDRISTRGWKRATVTQAGKRAETPITRLLDAKSWLPEWSEVIVFLAGRLGTLSEPLIDLLDSGRKDIACRRPILALRCLAELDTADRKPRQRDALTRRVYEFCSQSDRGYYATELPHEWWQALAGVNGLYHGVPLLVYLSRKASEGDLDSIRSLGAMGALAVIQEALALWMSGVGRPPRRESFWVSMSDRYSDVCLVRDGIVRARKLVRIGQRHFVNDVAIAFNIAREEAAVLLTNPPASPSRQPTVAEIIAARAVEFVSLVHAAVSE